MTKDRILKAVEIIDYAIKHKISVKEASKTSGFADTYVKNTKALVYTNYENGELDDETFSMFDEKYKEYEATKGLNISLTNDLIIQNNNITTTGGEQTKINYFDNKNEIEIEWNSGGNYPKNHIKTLDDLLKACEVDLLSWKVKDYTVNKWDVTSWKKENPETIQNFQVKARLERLLDNFRSKTAAEIFVEMTKNYKAPALQLKNINVNNVTSIENNLLEISIFDLHFGKLCWAGETGENFDVKIATERFISAINSLLKRASGFEYSRILFPVGSDFFNSDTILNTTTAGTPQDEDLRWQKTFKLGCKLLVDAINILKQTGLPVDVLVISGNHDTEKTLYMGEFLYAWFHNDPMIIIDNGAAPRKYYNFGDVLLGFTHGNEEKESSLPMLMANDVQSKPLWSKTKFHEFHVGHQHRKKNITYNVIDTKDRSLNEDLGVTIRYLSSLTSADAWHFRRGFVGAIKAADGFIWNDQTGLIAHINTNINI
jgi:hypothetical protein